MTVDSSPLLSLEGGGYRMRGPRPLEPAAPSDYGKLSKLRRRPTTSHNAGLDLVNQNIALLLAFLAVCCISCFAFAYHLYSSRWEDISWTDPFPVADGSLEVLAVEQGRSWPTVPQLGERYLSYLPHSGLHNQRIALENALILARLLNRTLLVPPLRLGRPIRYLPFETLYGNLQLLVKDGLEHCGRIPLYLSTPLECLDYADSTTVAWKELFDLSEIEEEQPMIQLDDISPPEYFHLLSPMGGGVLQVKDDDPYQFLFDDNESNVAGSASKFYEAIPLDNLSKAPHNLVQLGSLFGTNRLLLGREAAVLRSSIRQRMVVKHAMLDKAADSIHSAIPSPYVGVHLRLGDGSFLERRNQTILETWCSLTSRRGPDGQSLTGHLDTSVTPFNCPSPLNPRSHTSSYHLAQGEVNRQPWRRRRTTTAIFISTDLKHPEADPILHPFRQIFPRLYFLSDFESQMKPLNRLRSKDGISLRPFLIPILEALVVARGDSVVGTRGSTFSKYIRETLWPQYHNHSHDTRKG